MKMPFLFALHNHIGHFGTGRGIFLLLAILTLALLIVIWPSSSQSK